MTVLIRLYARGPWRLGAQGPGMEDADVVLNADTLFSALCHAWLALYGSLTEMIRGFEEGDPPFLLSSGFPFDEKTWYPVKPSAPLPLQGVTDFKMVKRARFLPYSVWEQLRRGENVRWNGWQSIEGFLTRDPAFVAPYRLAVVPHVTLDRETCASNLYHTGKLHFRERCGFGFLVHFFREEWHDRLMSALEWLGETGIGGERSSGHGCFSFSEEPSPLEPGGSDRLLLLSPYSPRDVSELAGWDLERSSYQFSIRRGFADVPGDAHPRRRSLRLFSEGSVLRLDEQPKTAYGRLADVGPETFARHPIYRYGYAYAVEWRGKDDA